MEHNCQSGPFEKSKKIKYQGRRVLIYRDSLINFLYPSVFIQKKPNEHFISKPGIFPNQPNDHPLFKKTNLNFSSINCRCLLISKITDKESLCSLFGTKSKWTIQFIQLRGFTHTTQAQFFTSSNRVLHIHYESSNKVNYNCWVACLLLAQRRTWRQGKVSGPSLATMINGKTH